VCVAWIVGVYLVAADTLWPSPVGGLGPPKSAANEKARSVPTAFFLSAFLPGSGQLYNRQPVRALLYATVEGLSWWALWHYRRSGDRAFAAVRAYARQHWSVVRYARWLNGYSGYDGPPVSIRGEPTGDGERDWALVDLRELNAAERRARFHNGMPFSHELPPYGSQQYYELIGKYFQFAPGWSDYNGADNPQDRRNVPDRFWAYARQHARANELLRYAEYALMALTANHVLSALDALISARLHNVRIRVHGPDPTGYVRWGGALLWRWP
jgi:hypothetical protein